MKRIVLLVISFIMVFSLTTFAEPVQEKDETIPPVDGYAFNMTREDVREKLGNPFEIEGNTETYYEVEYFGISGHLIFNYENNQIDGVFWESPEKKVSEEELQQITEAIIAYFDEIFGTDEDVKRVLSTDEKILFRWKDDFNKTEGMFMTSESEKGIKFEIGLQKQLQMELPSSLQNLTPEQIQEALEALGN